MTRPTFCRRIVCPFLHPDAADETWCVGVPYAWKHGCVPPHRGIRAVVCVPAYSRIRGTSRVTSRRRPRLEARAPCPGARPCGPLRRQPTRPQRRHPVCEAAASRRFPRSERRSPDALPQPAKTGRPEALASGPPAASAYPILRGVSRRLCAALRLAAHCGSGRGAKDGARPVCLLPSSRPAYATAPVRQQGRRRRQRLRQGGTIHCGRTSLVCDSAQILAMCSSSRLAEKLYMPSPLTSESLENARASSRPTHAHIHRLQPTTNSEKLSEVRITSGDCR
jgi:hypothetical protein